MKPARPLFVLAFASGSFATLGVVAEAELCEGRAVKKLREKE
jgi:hypothetical protein